MTSVATDPPRVTVYVVEIHGPAAAVAVVTAGSGVRIVMVAVPPDVEPTALFRLQACVPSETPDEASVQVPPVITEHRWRQRLDLHLEPHYQLNPLQ